ncbi:MAG: RluA family pseudouridine synthase [Chromatiales bacterium]|nr:RluA family pseudouridine synthase [Chromatiales bacterium]
MNSIPYNPPHHDGLDLVFEDDWLLVVNKPSGLLSVPGRGEDKRDSLASRVMAEYPDALIVHRLDMSTSGLMVLAKGKQAHRGLSLLFQDQQMKKCYVAVVDGVVESLTGEVDLPLITDWPNRPRQKVDYELGKPSLTSYRVIGHNDEAVTTRIELKPKTGRSHQLRVHMLSIGHPIVGDELYASRDVIDKASRLLLHASALSFTHPVTKQRLSFKSDVPF